MLRLFLILLQLFCSAIETIETPHQNVTLVDPILIRYCPFQVNVSLASDLSSLDITYSAKSANPGPRPLGVHQCYARVQFAFDKRTYAYTINEIEYVTENEKSITGNIQTRVAWEFDSGPTHFTPVALSSTSSAQIAKNTTYASGAGCNDDLFLNILTSFDEKEVNSVSVAHLKQHVKLQWRTRTWDGPWNSDKFCLQYEDCRSVDVDGIPSWPDTCTFPKEAI